MKRTLLFTVMFFVIATSFAQTDSLNCAAFKTGKFYYKEDSSKQTIKIKRTSNKQEETNTVTGVVIKYRIKWTSPCSYELKQLWSSSKATRKLSGNESKVIISKTGVYFYDYSCACKNPEDAKKYSGTVYKVSETER